MWTPQRVFFCFFFKCLSFQKILALSLFSTDANIIAFLCVRCFHVAAFCMPFFNPCLSWKKKKNTKWCLVSTLYPWQKRTLIQANSHYKVLKFYNFACNVHKGCTLSLCPNIIGSWGSPRSHPMLFVFWGIAHAGTQCTDMTTHIVYDSTWQHTLSAMLLTLWISCQDDLFIFYY